MLVGSSLHNVDVKGRVFIPSKFRLDLGSHFYVYSNFDGCVRGYNEREWAKLVEQLSQLPIEANQVKRLIFSSAVEVDMDSQGRILLPEELRSHAMIVDKTKIIGMNTWVEFWCPERAEQLENSITPQSAIEYLGAIGVH